MNLRCFILVSFLYVFVMVNKTKNPPFRAGLCKHDIAKRLSQHGTALIIFCHHQLMMLFETVLLTLRFFISGDYLRMFLINCKCFLHH